MKRKIRQELAAIQTEEFEQYFQQWNHQLDQYIKLNKKLKSVKEIVKKKENSGYFYTFFPCSKTCQNKTNLS